MTDGRGATITRRLMIATLPAVIATAPAPAIAQSRRSQNGIADMARTVLPNDIVRLQRFDESLARVGDIVVYMHRRADGWDDRLRPYMKRIIALPGQRIAFRDSVPVLDGVSATSEFLRTEDLEYEGDGPTVDPALHRYRETLAGRSYDTYRPEPGPSSLRQNIRNVPEIVVPAGKLFVVGDHRHNSMDSRWDGPIEIGAVRRRAVSILRSIDPARVGLAL